MVAVSPMVFCAALQNSAHLLVVRHNPLSMHGSCPVREGSTGWDGGLQISENVADPHLFLDDFLVKSSHV